MPRDRLGTIVLGSTDHLAEAIFRFLKLPNGGVGGGHPCNLDGLARMQVRTELLRPYFDKNVLIAEIETMSCGPTPL